MIIYIASDGQARLVSPQHVYQGSSVTDITVIAPFPAQTAMTVAFSLPDGKMFGGVQGAMQTPQYVMTLLANQPELPDNVYAWQYVMSSAITQNAGQAKVSVTAQFAQGSGKATTFTQQTSAQVEFTIEPSVPGELPGDPTQDAWSEIINALAATQGNVTANTSDIEDIVDGTTAVGKAVADQNGNVIDETYATKTALAATNEALAVEQENVDDLQSRMTAAEGNITEIRDDASDALEYSEQAFDNSELAVQTANQAKTVADGIDAKATTALETANAASSNAAQALQKANAATETANAAQAAVASKQDATDNNLDTTDKTVVGAINENKTAIDGLRQDILNEAHFRGYFATNAEIQATTANLNDFAYSAQSGTVWIYGESGWADSGKPVPDKTTPLSDATPAQDGTATAGASTSAARGDHVHPTDNTRAAKSTVDNIISGAQVVGAATKATQDANGNVIDETYATKTELVETSGTEVKINGATQSEVNFTSDPQTQITANKNAIAVIPDTYALLPTSVTDTSRASGQWVVGTGGTPVTGKTMLLGTFSIYDTNIWLHISGGVARGGSSNYTTDVNVFISSLQGTVNEAYCYVRKLYKSSRTTGIYYTVDSSNYLRIYAAVPQYGKMFVSAEISGGSIVGKGSSEDVYPSGGQYITEKNYADLSQVVRVDTAQQFTDAQKWMFSKNSRFNLQKAIERVSQWKTVACISNYGQVCMAVSTDLPSSGQLIDKFFLAIGYGNTANITQIGYATTSPISAIRLRSTTSAKTYIDLLFNENTTVATTVSVYFEANLTNKYSSVDIDLFDFVDFSGDESDYTITMLNLCNSGINTTGTIYQQGAPVFATDPSKLTPSTANGWTQTTATGSLPSAGVYMVAPNARVGTLGIGVMFYAADRVSVSAIGAPSGAISLYYISSGDTKWALYDENGTSIQLTDVHYKRIA